MKKWMKLGLVAMLAVSLMATVVGCGSTPKEAPKTEPAKQEAPKKEEVKKLKVGTDAAYAPFEWKNEKGEIVGFDIDLMKEIAKEIGAEIEFVNTPFDGIIPALTNKNVDMIISAMTITDKRKQTVNFSDPYFVAVQSIAVPVDSAVKGMSDIKALAVGVQNGTTGAEVVEKLMDAKNPNIRRFDTTPDALNNLINGSVKAVVADKPVVQNFLKNNPTAKLKVVDDNSFEKEEYGIAIRKEDTDLLKKVNDALKKLKDSKKIDEISDKYLSK